MTRQEYRSIRKALSMTQTQLATELGISWITVCKRENGKVPLTEESSRAIQTLCGHKFGHWEFSTEENINFRNCEICGMSEVK